MGRGCGSVGRVVASDTLDPRFESHYQQKNIEHLFTVNCIEKTKISSLCSNNFHKIKTPYLGGIRTGIVEVEGKHIDHRGPFKYILLSSFEQND